MKLHSIALAIIASSAVSTVAHAASYKIDSSHSEVGFKVRHLTISNVKGAFTNFDGDIDFDPKNIAASKVTATISAKSISTNHEKRDAHLRDTDFLSVEKFPSLSFSSKSVESTGEGRFKVLGDLTLHGLTKPVTLDVTYEGSAKDLYGNDRVAFSAKTAIKRSDYGLTWNKLMETGGAVVGDEVLINLDIEATKQG